MDFHYIVPSRIKQSLKFNTRGQLQGCFIIRKTEFQIFNFPSAYNMKYREIYDQE
ncbi:hypothetical protein pb186bvf_003828 [Paramecium bursaria]